MFSLKIVDLNGCAYSHILSKEIEICVNSFAVAASLPPLLPKGHPFSHIVTKRVDTRVGGFSGLLPEKMCAFSELKIY